jgi:hypothetical protein
LSNSSVPAASVEDRKIATARVRRNHVLKECLFMKTSRWTFLWSLSISFKKGKPSPRPSFQKGLSDMTALGTGNRPLPIIKTIYLEELIFVAG